MRMETCQRCGGAIFYGSGAVGWGGPICNCQYPQVPNPDVPPQGSLGGLSSFGNAEVIELLRRIAAGIDALVERGNT